MKKSILELYVDWVRTPFTEEEEEFEVLCKEKTGNEGYEFQAPAFLAGYNVAIKEMEKALKTMEE